MANNQSWEFYQQPFTGSKYPLRWIAGASNCTQLSVFQLSADVLYLIPFNQMRDVTVSKIGVWVQGGGGTGVQIRLGIYGNNASNDNYPKTLVKDAGTINVVLPADLGIRMIANVNTNLSADNRYWAAVICNDNSLSIAGLPTASPFFWGAFETTGATPTIKIPNGIALGQTYGALPNPAGVTGAVAEFQYGTTTPAVLFEFSAVT